MNIFRTNKTLLLISLNLLIIVILVGLLKPSWEIGSDGYGYYIYARSLIFDHDLDFNNEYQQFVKQYSIAQPPSLTKIGKTANMFSVGPAILWSPFILTAYLIDQGKNPLNSYGLPGFNLPYQLAVFFGTLCYFFLGLYLLYLSLKKLFSEKIALGATSLIWLISPLVYYLIYEPSMAHSLGFFALSGLFYFFLKYQDKATSRGFIILGLWLGLASLIRWQNLLFGILPLFLLWQQRDNLKQTVKHFMVLIATVLLILLPQLLTWQYLYGSLVAIPQGTRFFALFKPNLSQFLFSGYHGLFSWHPLLLLSIFGLGWFFKINRKIALLLFLALALQIYLNSGLVDWWAGGAFGSRRMVDSTFIFAVGLGGCFSFLANKKILLTLASLLLLIGLVGNLLLLVACSKKIIPINRPLSAGELLKGQEKTFQLLLEKISLKKFSP